MSSLTCPYSRRCGGCQLLAMSYEEELAHKQELARRHLSRFGKLLPILGAANPCYYRNKVEAAFGLDRSRKVIAGTYEPRSHRIVDINSCLNEDKNATAIIVTIKSCCLPSASPPTMRTPAPASCAMYWCAAASTPGRSWWCW